MATQERVADLSSEIEKALSFDIERLIRNQSWGTFNFEDCRQALTDSHSLIRPLASLPLRYMDDGNISKILEEVRNYSTQLTIISRFSIEEGNPSENRNSIANQVKNSSDRLYRVIAPNAAFLALQRGDIEKAGADLSRTLSDARRMVSEAQAFVQTQTNEIESIMTQAREVAAVAGVGHFSADFSKEVVRLDKAAGHWLIATTLIGLVTIFSAAGSFFVPIDKDASYPLVLQFAVSKLILLGLLISGTFWCGRMYRALKHQAALNRHRENALKTFQAFVKAAADDASRDAVLLETTRSIFTVGSSGYFSEPESNGMDAMKVVELIRPTPARAPT